MTLEIQEVYHDYDVRPSPVLTHNSSETAEWNLMKLSQIIYHTMSQCAYLPFLFLYERLLEFSEAKHGLCHWSLTGTILIATTLKPLNVDFDETFTNSLSNNAILHIILSFFHLNDMEISGVKHGICHWPTKGEPSSCPQLL